MTKREYRLKGPYVVLSFLLLLFCVLCGVIVNSVLKSRFSIISASGFRKRKKQRTSMARCSSLENYYSSGRNFADLDLYLKRCSFCIRGFLLTSSPSFSRGFSFRKLQIFISQTTNSHFANYRFPFRKLQIFISQTTDFHFVSFHFVSLHFVSQTNNFQANCTAIFLLCFCLFLNPDAEIMLNLLLNTLLTIIPHNRH